MKKILVCAALSALLFTGCTIGQDKTAVIKVNDKVITKSQIENAIDKEINSSPFKAFGGASNIQKSDDNMMYLIFKEKVSKEMIIKTLIDEESDKRGIKVSEEDIKKEMDSIIEKVGSKDELTKLLKQRGVSNTEFMADLETQVKIKKLVNSIEKVKISDSDINKFYKENINQFTHGEQVRASHILISADTLGIIKDIKDKNAKITPEELNKEVEKIVAQKKVKAEEVLKEVKANPENFEKLAQKYSEDNASGERGGELGFFTKDAMVPEFSKAAFSMKPNTVSETLVKTPYGFHIIKVTDKVAAGTTPLAKVKDEIKFYLETQKQIAILKNLTDGLMKSAKIEYVDSTYDPKYISEKTTKQREEVSQKFKDAGVVDNDKK